MRHVLVLLDTGPKLDCQGNLAQHLVHSDKNLAELSGSVEDWQDRYCQLPYENVPGQTELLTSRPSSSLEDQVNRTTKVNIDEVQPGAFPVIAVLFDDLGSGNHVPLLPSTELDAEILLRGVSARERPFLFCPVHDSIPHGHFSAGDIGAVIDA